MKTCNPEVIEIVAQGVDYFNDKLSMAMKKYIEPQLETLYFHVNPKAESIDGRRPEYMRGVFLVHYRKLNEEEFYRKTEHYIYSRDMAEVNESMVEYRESDITAFEAEGYDVVHEMPPKVDTYKYRFNKSEMEYEYVTRIRFMYTIKLNKDKVEDTLFTY